jgi:hypothetical protein
MGWVGAPDPTGIAGVESAPVYRIWSEPVIHVGDCEIIPAASYEIRATPDGVVFTAPLSVSTIAQPAPKFYGDVVGVFNGSEWTAPQGVVNFADVTAVQQRAQSAATAPHVTRADVVTVGIGDPCLNRIGNTADVFLILKAFQSNAYPFTTDPALCPPCP